MDKKKILGIVLIVLGIILFLLKVDLWIYLVVLVIGIVFSFMSKKELSPAKAPAEEKVEEIVPKVEETPVEPVPEEKLAEETPVEPAVEVETEETKETE